jgi:hypothetical protein
MTKMLLFTSTPREANRVILLIWILDNWDLFTLLNILGVCIHPHGLRFFFGRHFWESC